MVVFQDSDSLQTIGIKSVVEMMLESPPLTSKISLSLHIPARGQKASTFYEIVFIMRAGHMGPLALDSCPP